MSAIVHAVGARGLTLRSYTACDLFFCAQTMTASTDFELLFDSAPISLWLEDYSSLKVLFDQWRAQGVTDLEAHLRADPTRAAQCSQCYQVLRVNQQTLRLFGASSQEELITRLPEVFRGDMFERMVAFVGKHVKA